MENKRTQLRAILAVGSLALGLSFMWFFSNFFYDLFWAYLDKRHVRQADVIAYTLAHIIPFVGAIVVVAGLYFSIRHQFTGQLQAPTKLKYLHNEDYPLGAAIMDMAWHSAWAKWFASQYLATNNHHPASEEHVMQIATGIVHDALMDGQLEVQGRKPGQLDYKPIPRTHWRSTALHMIPDRRSLWKMILIPTGGAEIHPDGTVVGHDQRAIQRTDQLAAYDSLIVSARQFEKLWPRKDKDTDAARKRLLKTARKAGADPVEIEKLSRD